MIKSKLIVDDWFFLFTFKTTHYCNVARRERSLYTGHICLKPYIINAFKSNKNEGLISSKDVSAAVSNSYQRVLCYHSSARSSKRIHLWNTFFWSQLYRDSIKKHSNFMMPRLSWQCHGYCEGVTVKGHECIVVCRCSQDQLYEDTTPAWGEQWSH